MADEAVKQAGGGEGATDAAVVPTEAKPAESSPTEVPKEAESTKADIPVDTEAPKETETSKLPEVSNKNEVPKTIEAVETKVEEAPKDSNAPKADEGVSQEQKIVESQPSSNEPKVEETKPEEPKIEDVKKVEESPAPQQNGDWNQREAELLKKIEELEKVKNDAGVDGLKLELKVREEEIDLLKARVKNLETELQAALSKPGAKNHEMIENIKQQHEELLSKAKGMIFDKTKMVKNQELQIEALTTQVASLKDINMITKDLLEIRNGEVKAMEDRLEAMEARFKAEKQRHGLVLQRAEASSGLNDDLKKEYETQLKLFKELRGKYEERVQALVAENNRLKESLKSGTSG